eukprot:evm.model.NODE_33100_length_7234_cov_40.057369.4
MQSVPPTLRRNKAYSATTSMLASDLTTSDASTINQGGNNNTRPSRSVTAASCLEAQEPRQEQHYHQHHQEGNPPCKPGVFTRDLSAQTAATLTDDEDESSTCTTEGGLSSAQSLAEDDAALLLGLGGCLDLLAGSLQIEREQREAAAAAAAAAVQ